MTLLPKTTLEISVTVFTLVLVSLGCALSHSHLDFFTQHFIVEDGPIEWLSTLALAATMILCIKRVYQLRKDQTPLFLAITFLIGLLFFFAVGEELSWGQRIFSIESNEFFQKNNAQGETNLHNLVIDGKKINKIIFSRGIAIIFVLYLFVITPIYRYHTGFAQFIDRMAIPIPQNYQIISYIIILIIAQLLTDAPKKGELNEFGGAFIIFLNFLAPYNKHIFRKK